MGTTWMNAAVGAGGMGAMLGAGRRTMAGRTKVDGLPTTAGPVGLVGLARSASEAISDPIETVRLAASA
jgi:hypothetical protein